MFLRVTVTCADGGQATDTHYVNTEATGGDTGGPIPDWSTEEIEENQADETGLAFDYESMKVYPNPSSGEFTIAFYSPKEYERSVLNIQRLDGQIASTIAIPLVNQGTNLVTLTPELPVGMYVLVLQNEDLLLSKKIVVK